MVRARALSDRQQFVEDDGQRRTRFCGFFAFCVVVRDQDPCRRKAPPRPTGARASVRRDQLMRRAAEDGGARGPAIERRERKKSRPTAVAKSQARRVGGGPRNSTAVPASF